MRLRSRILVYNETQLPFEIFVQCKDTTTEVGTLCCTKPKSINKREIDKGSQYLDRECIGIPDHLLEGYFSSPKNDSSSYVDFLFSSPTLLLRVSRKQFNCQSDVNDFWSRIVLPSYTDLHRVASSSTPDKQTITKLNLVFKAENSSLLPTSTDMTIHAAISIRMVEDHPLIDISLQPRLILQNNLPLPVMVRTPDAYTLSPCKTQKLIDEEFEGQTLHFLNPHDAIEIFNSRDFVRISTKFVEADDDSNLSSYNWMKGEFIDLFLGERKFLHNMEDDMVCLFPTGNKEEIGDSAGFVIVENLENFGSIDTTSAMNIDVSSISLAVPKFAPSLSMAAQCIIIDHMERFLIETVQFQTERDTMHDSKHSLSSKPQFSALDIFTSQEYPRFMLVPDTSSHVRICTDESTSETKKVYSNPFKIDGIDIGIGGFESSQLFWEDLANSGYYIYRKVVDMGVLVTELHIIPEYMIENSTEFTLLITYNDKGDNNCVKLTLDPLQRKPLILSQSVSNTDLHVKIEVPEKGYFTNPITVNDLNEQVCDLYSISDNSENESCLTVNENLTIVAKVGKESERILIDIGSSKRTSQASTVKELSECSESKSQNDDVIRIIMKCQQVFIKIQIAGPPDGFLLSKFDDFRIKYQRLFLCADNSSGREERSQLKIYVGNMNLSDSDESEEFQKLFHSPGSSDIFMDFSLLYAGSLIKNVFSNDEKLVVHKLNFNIDSSDRRDEKQKLKLKFSLYSDFLSRLMLFMNLLATTNIAECDGTIKSTENWFESFIDEAKNDDDNGNHNSNNLEWKDKHEKNDNSVQDDNDDTDSSKKIGIATKTSKRCRSSNHFGLFDKLSYFNLIEIGCPGVEIDSVIRLSDSVRLRSVEDGRNVVLLKHFIGKCQLASSSSQYPGTTLAFKNLSCSPKNLLEVIISSLIANLKYTKSNMAEDDWMIDNSNCSSIKNGDTNNQWDDLEAFAHAMTISKNDIQCKEEEDFQLALNFFDNEDASVTQSQSSGSTSPKAKNLFSFFQ